MKELFKKAHKITREIIKTGDDYRATFGFVLSYLFNKKGENKMVELKGTEKQIKWADDIRDEVASLIQHMKEEVKNFSERDGKDYTEKYTERMRNVEKILDEESAKFFIDNFKALTYIRKEMNQEKDEFFLEELHNKMLFEFKDGLRNVGIKNVSRLINSLMK